MRFMYLWQAPGWPGLTWDANAVTAPLAQARLAQGRMLGLAGSLGVTSRRNPASRSRHIPATLGAFAGHLEAG
jgi:hypothetical protein